MENKNVHIKAFVIVGVHENNRLAHIEKLKKQLLGLQRVDAIFPSRQKVPFINKLIKLSKSRTGKALNHGEIGVILSNRLVWREIVKNATSDEQHFLILESDSVINDLMMLHQLYSEVEANYDLFFWGAWLGHAQILRSTKKRIKPIQKSSSLQNNALPKLEYSIGTPFYKTICSGYGYSLNKKAAAYLLACTNQIAFPIDEFKRYSDPNFLRWGTVKPEIITQGEGVTTIGHNSHPLIEKIWMGLLDIRNKLICYYN